MVYVIVDIGCIECGEETQVIGIYDSKEMAKQSLAEYKDKVAPGRVSYDKSFGYFGAGEHSVEIFEVAQGKQ